MVASTVSGTVVTVEEFGLIVKLAENIRGNVLVWLAIRPRRVRT